MDIDRQSITDSGFRRKTQQEIKEIKAQEISDAQAALKAAFVSLVNQEQPSLSIHCSRPQLKISCVFSTPNPLMLDGGVRVVLDVSPKVAPHEKTRILGLINAVAQTIMEGSDISLCLNSEKYEKVS